MRLEDIGCSCTSVHKNQGGCTYSIPSHMLSPKFYFLDDCNIGMLYLLHPKSIFDKIVELDFNLNLVL